MTPLLHRLPAMAHRREQVIPQLTLPELRDMARQDVADIREAVAELNRRMVH